MKKNGCLQDRPRSVWRVLLQGLRLVPPENDGEIQKSHMIGANRTLHNAEGRNKKESEGSWQTGFPPGILRRCAPRAIAAQWGEPRARFRTESQTKKSPKAFDKQGSRREYFVAALLVPLLRNGANRGSVSAPKAKQKRARRLFFVWYSRWEYFAQIGACGLPNVVLRSCHCCAMGRTRNGPLGVAHIL